VLSRGFFDSPFEVVCIEFFPAWREGFNRSFFSFSMNERAPF